MPQAYADNASIWTQAARTRRKGLLQRLGVGATAAMIFSPMLGWDFGALWLVGYLLIEMLGLWAFAPVNGGQQEKMSAVRNVAGGAAVFLSAAYFAALSVPLWLMGGPMGGICAVVLLSAGSLYALTNTSRSRSFMLLTAAPQFVFLGLAPLFMAYHGAKAAIVIAAAIGVGVYVAYCISAWRRMNTAQAAEAEARLEAERGRREAERVMAGRSAFLNTIGHDLRTPISAMLTGASQLESGSTDAASRAQARLIVEAGHMMKALLDDLLDHAKLESGHMTTEAADFDLRALVASTMRLWQGPARAKGLKLRVEGAASLPRVVRGDAMRLNQILNNLISNAMKFTDKGAITLRLAAWPEDAGGHAVMFEIVDTGPGMTPEQMARLFTAFDQTAEGVSARHGGTGLGLSISRELARLMGGRLTARSQPGQGAHFTLALNFADCEEQVSASPVVLDRETRQAVARSLTAPRGAPAPAPAAPVVMPEPARAASSEADFEAHEEDAAGDGGRPLRVLVVDDHDINRRAIQLILAPLGCDVTTAADGLIALGAAEAAAFDIIFMDVRMPELDGRETTRRLRAGGGPNARTPVIAVTADTAPEDIAACTEAGMDYFVPKPITPGSLLSAVEQVLVAPAQGDEAGEDTRAA